MSDDEKYKLTDKQDVCEILHLACNNALNALNALREAITGIKEKRIDE